MYLSVDPSSFMSTSRPPDVIHVTGVPRSSPVFRAFPLPCIILNANQRTKTGEAWERGFFTPPLKLALHSCHIVTEYTVTYSKFQYYASFKIIPLICGTHNYYQTGSHPKMHRMCHAPLFWVTSSLVLPAPSFRSKSTISILPRKPQSARRLMLYVTPLFSMRRQVFSSAENQPLASFISWMACLSSEISPSSTAY